MNERLGVIVIPRTKSGEVLLLPQLEENDGKSEMVVGFHSDYVLVAGLEFPAGAVENRDAEQSGGFSQLVLAAMRELAEEAGLVGNLSQLRALEGELTIHQLRGGGEVCFTGHAFELILTEDQENWMVDHGKAVYANHVDLSEVRPRDQAVIQMLSLPTELSLAGKENAYA